MKSMHGVAVAAVALFAGSAVAQISAINSLNVAPYWYADFFGRSTLTVTNNGLSSLRIEDRNFSGSGFTNRHHAALSVNDAPYQFGQTDSFRFDVDVIIEGQGGTEAGIWLGTAPNYPNSGSANVGQFVMLPGNNGEIAAFGGPLPFFSNNNIPAMDRAARNQTFHMTLIYEGGATPSMNYGVNGVFTGPQRGFMDSFAGIDANTLMGVYVQGPNGNLGDVDVTFSNLQIVPAPMSAALLGVGGLMAARRRR